MALSRALVLMTIDYPPMLTIRLARIGRKNTAAFRMVLQEKTRAPKSAAQETLGSYNPHLPKREEQMQLNKERILYWLSKGAQPSPTVHNMLIETGIMTGKKKRVVHMNKKSAEGEAAATEGTAPEATPAKK
ncbi:MAG: 30S ribosomal protein S16 [Candidatus Kerfeldbacteria bacterium]|nr:30S ribosomal protein S16 [Candidatus Kerfeldbacteria bacterium]